MRLSIDLDTRGFIESANFPRPVTVLTLKRGDNVPLEISFVRDGAVQELADGATGKVGLKPKGQFGSAFYLALDNGWEKSGADVTASYAFSLNLATTEIESAFLAEPEFVLTMLEIEWVESGLRTSSETLDVELQNDVHQGDEGVPQQATPPYPESSDVLTKSGNLAGIADPAAARAEIGAGSDEAVEAAQAAADAAQAKANGSMGVIVHGAVASTARLGGYAVVTWIGTVEPTNAAATLAAFAAICAGSVVTSAFGAEKFRPSAVFKIKASAPS